MTRTRMSDLEDGYEAEAEDTFMVWKDGMLYKSKLIYLNEDGQAFNYLSDQEAVAVYVATADSVLSLNNMIEDHYAPD